MHKTYLPFSVIRVHVWHQRQTFETSAVRPCYSQIVLF